jgi:DNA-binding protein WhiA
VERDLVSAVWAELAAIEPARRCDRIAERAGLGLEARGRARTPAIGRLAVRLGDGDAGEGFDWEAAAPHCRVAYLRGLLLANASLSVTPRGTHLELVMPPGDAGAVADRLEALGFPAGRRIRRGRGVLTWKDSEANIGLLRRLGSSSAALQLETGLLSRALHGHMNRVVNAEGANLRRAVEAAHRQLAHIDALERTGLLRRLTPRTRRVIDQRRRAPEATFSEIAAALGISRGQVQRAFYELESLALHQDDAA